MSKHLLTLWDLAGDEILSLLHEARAIKEAPMPKLLDGKTLGLVFEKASTRTKVSFAVAAYRLGAHVVTLEQASSQLGRGESYADTARVLSQYVDGIVLRTFAQSNAEEMAEYSSVPVINGLSDQYHPCQLLADLMTIQEEKGSLDGLTISWVGDGNNMCHSWITAAAKLGFKLRVGTPKGREPDTTILARAKGQNSSIELMHDAQAAVEDADVINVDTWESMGQEDESNTDKIFSGFQLNDTLLKSAAADAIVLHCLPAHRGHEITDEVIDGPQSRVWQEAGNRLPVQQAILARYMK